MASVNKAIIVGNVGKGPEMRYMPNGEAVANFSVATTDNWKDKNGQKQSKSEWHNVVAYRKLAEIIGEYVKQGSGIYIEGSIQTRKWQTKEGQDRYTTEIIASSMQMLGSASHADNGGNGKAQRQDNKANDQVGFDDIHDDVQFYKG